MSRCLTIIRGIAVIGCALLSACQTFSRDGGMSVTADIAGKTLNKNVAAIRSEEDAAAARAEVERLLKRALTADSAVQIALLNNRGLQAAYNELGIAEAVRVQQSLPPNPHFSLTRMTGSVETEIEREIVASILAIATLPARSEIATERFRQAQLAAGLETLRVAAEARRAFYRAVAAQETVGLFTQANEAAETMTQLAKRLGETGAMNKLDQAREQAFHSDVAVRLASAQQRAARERERLVRVLALWGNDLKFALPKSLPALPKRTFALPTVEQEAVRRRVDLQIARIELATLAKAYGLTNATRFINVLEAGYADKLTKEKQSGENIRDRGFTVSFEVPLFDFGEARVREAEQTYMQAVNRLAQKAVNVRSEAREAYRNYRSSYDIASHYQRDVLPLRKIISDEMMLHYGAMQVDVFTLLLEAQQKLNANVAAADAFRDFWLASTDLSTAMTGGGMNPAETPSIASPAAGGSAGTDIDEETTMISRRNLIGGSAILAGAAAVSGRVQAAAIPEAVTTTSPAMQPPLVPSSGPAYQPVVTLNGWTLPWRMNGDWKEFHLVAEPVTREIAPGMKAHLWGYNGQSPGPTLECVEGDKVRIFVTNKLPEHTTIHWHGMLVPNGMDGVGGLTQPHIKPGQTFVYEFALKKSGTFMYHPHADEMVQMAMGMMGFFVVHPRDPKLHRVDRDFVFLMSSYDIDPGSYLPKVMTMTDFNLWTWNSRVFPGIDPLVVRRGDRVRVRIGNLTMTNHPIHMHGYHFEVTGTDGGWIPESARIPEVTTDVPVGAMRAYEFVAEEPGDWAIHCHKSHHTMNAMGHNVKTFIGVQQRDLTKAIRKLMPDYMPMGSAGMAEMGSMEMPMPDNTLPMMTGFGQFGPLEMGGMFSVVKVREGLARDDYKDPGPYKNPPGTVAYQFKGAIPEAPSRKGAAVPQQGEIEVTVVKSRTNGHNSGRH